MNKKTKKAICRICGIICFMSAIMAWYFAERYGQMVEGASAWDMFLPLGICAISGFSAYLLGEGAK